MSDLAIARTTPIKKGMSGDKKYLLELENGEKNLLRVSNISDRAQKSEEFGVMQEIYARGVPMPRPIDFGVCGDGRRVYTRVEWIDGEEAERLLPSQSPDEQYRYGTEADRILRAIHHCPAPAGIHSWQERYFAVIDERLAAYRREGIPFEGADLILRYLDENRSLLADRPQCRHHGDYHMGNLIIDKEGALKIIDWHTVDFSNIGDPWYEFNRIGIEHPAFAAGEIDGYFDGNVPCEFWLLLNYYLAASAITSIVWAKYFAPKELDRVIGLCKNVLCWTGGFSRKTPTWYEWRKAPAE